MHFCEKEREWFSPLDGGSWLPRESRVSPGLFATLLHLQMRSKTVSILNIFMIQRSQFPGIAKIGRNRFGGSYAWVSGSCLEFPLKKRFPARPIFPCPKLFKIWQNISVQIFHRLTSRGKQSVSTPSRDINNKRNNIFHLLPTSKLPLRTMPGFITGTSRAGQSSANHHSTRMPGRRNPWWKSQPSPSTLASLSSQQMIYLQVRHTVRSSRIFDSDPADFVPSTGMQKSCTASSIADLGEQTVRERERGGGCVGMCNCACGWE